LKSILKFKIMMIVGRDRFSGLSGGIRAVD